MTAESGGAFVRGAAILALEKQDVKGEFVMSDPIPSWLQIFPWLALLVSTWAVAAEDPFYEGGLDNFLAEETELATKTRLTIDYVPGIIDVIRGESLAERGVRTVWDALAFVPGINPVMDNLGHRRVMVRGLGDIGDNRFSGYVKMMLNGVSMNDSAKASADPLFFIPIEQVDRIEVMRGPGSAIHGEHAVAGVINIVTYSDRNMVFVSSGSFNEQGLGLSMNHGLAADPVNFSLNLSAWRSDGADMRVEKDTLYQIGYGDISNAPGNANEGIVAKTGVFRTKIHGFSFLAQWSESRLGDYFGTNFTLPSQDDRLVEHDRIRQIEGRYNLTLGSGRVELFLGERNHLVTKEHLFINPGEYYQSGAEQDLEGKSNYEEQRRYWGVDYHQNVGRHRWLLGLYQADVNVLQGTQAFNMTNEGAIVDDFVPQSYPIQRDSGRYINSTMVQDEIRYSDLFSVTVGGRYDHYSGGIGASLSPRIAGVWRFSEARVFKAQYGRSFRPATLYEIGANALLGASTALDPTTVDTLEIGYFRKYPLAEWRMTAAYSELRDVIVYSAESYAFSNADSGRLRSVELVGGWGTGTGLWLDGSLSVTDTDLSSVNGHIPGSSQFIGRVGARYRLNSWLVGALDYRRVEGFSRQPSDPRGERGYDIVNLTLTARSESGYSLRMGIGNIFDSQVAYPSFLLADSSGEPTVSYPDDLVQPGRTWWLEGALHF